MKPVIEYVNDIAVIRFSGELTIHNSQKAKSFINDQFLKGYNKIILVMQDVTYIDSTALGMLVALYKTTRTENQQIVISGTNENLRRLLQLTRLNTFFVVYDDFDEALEKLIGQ